MELTEYNQKKGQLNPVPSAEPSEKTCELDDVTAPVVNMACFTEIEAYLQIVIRKKYYAKKMIKKYESKLQGVDGADDRKAMETFRDEWKTEYEHRKNEEEKISTALSNASTKCL